MLTNSHRHSYNHSQSGYIALFSTIILLAIFVLLFVGMFALAMGGMRRISAKEDSLKANSVAIICLEKALAELRKDPDYDIGEHISFENEGSCGIENVLRNENEVSFESAGIFSGYTRKIHIKVNIEEEGGERTLDIVGWEEI